MKVGFIGANSFLANSFGKYLNLVSSFGNYVDVKIDNIIAYGRKKPINYKYNVFYEIDFLKPEELFFKSLVSCDIIFYFAASGVQANRIDSSTEIYEINTFLPMKIIDFLKKEEYKGKIITFGSYFEIGENAIKKRFNEEDILTLLTKSPNHYVTSKRLLSSFFKSDKHTLQWYHFILPTIYGEGENSNRLIPYIVNSLRNKVEIKITSGLQVREYLFVEDAVKIIWQTVLNDFNSNLYNIQGSEVWQIKELVKAIFSHFNIDFFENIQIIDRYDESMVYLQLDGSLLKNKINYSPIVKVLDIIDKY